MIELSSCPVCSSSDITTLLSTVSRYDNSFGSHNIAILNHLLKNVLHKESVLVHAKQCRKCKQIFMSSTFSPQEMSRLYSEDGDNKLNQFYQKAREKSGLSFYEDFSGDELLGKKYAEESIAFRGRFIFDVTTSFRKKPINKLLDIGGGDGNNILSFEKSGKYLFDLVPHKKIDSRIEVINDLKTAHSLAPFDLIVSTHTLEHIVQSQKTVLSYAGLVKPGSLFYVEVPAEYARLYIKYLSYPLLQKGAHANWHVNYFSPGSLQTLFSLSGYKTLYLKTRFMPYNNLRPLTIIGLFEYTGVPRPYFRSSTGWHCDFLKNILMDVKVTGHKKLFKKYPALRPFEL